MLKRFCAACLLLLGAAAPHAAQNGARAVLTLADAPLRLIRGVAVFKAGAGVALQRDDILETAAGGAQIELGPNAILALGPRTRVLLASLPANAQGGVEVALLQGWLKVGAGGATVLSPALRVNVANGSTIVRADAHAGAGAGGDAVFAEEGAQQVARLDPSRLQGEAPLKLAPEQYAALASDKPQLTPGRPPRAFVALMPPAFRDRLVPAPRVANAGKPVPGKEREVDFSDVDAWLRAPAPLRKNFVARFRPRLSDAGFRKALERALGNSAEWKPVLHPAPVDPRSIRRKTMKLSIAAKFNLVFVSIFAIGFVAAGAVADRLLKQSAREETLQNARLLLEAAKSVRGYTAGQIAPLLANQMRFEFHPQSVPSYSAVETLNVVLKSYPDFAYKEATLNPTNLRDKASDWEVDVVQKLRRTPGLKEFVGERDSATGRSLFIARPVQIQDPVCLACHTTAAEAPKTMIDIYGPNNGFGWKLNEIVGAQVISVPMAVPLRRANGIFETFMLSLFGVFVAVFVALNVMVHLFVTRRIKRLAGVADEVSMGKFEADEFEPSGSDEISGLARSFNRMRTSLASALKMLDD